MPKKGFRATHCRNGHEYSPENTTIIKRSNREDSSYRRCKACTQANTIARREQPDYRLYMMNYTRKYQRERAGVHITDEEVSEILISQDGLCAICYEKPAVVLDHDHETGHVRGMLCRGCNLGLGLLGDNEESLRLALEYLAVPRIEEVV